MISPQTVLITGANGFVALHTIGVLLSKGYKVIGTVRTQEKADKVTKQFTGKYGSELVQAQLKFVLIPDLTDKASFDKLFQQHPEIDHVLHTAAPYVMGLENFEESYLKPAVQGTKTVMESIKDYAPQVKKVVFTSSAAAMMDVSRLTQDDYVITEESWNPITWGPHINSDFLAYLACKTVSEQAAWEASKDKDVKYKLIVVNPVYVYGPTFFDEDSAAKKINESCQILKEMVLNTDPSDTHLFNEHNFLAVDVRDIAKMHVFPLQSDKADGQRLFGVACSFNDQEMLNLVHKHLDVEGKAPKGVPEKAAELKPQKFNNDKTKEILGADFEFIGLEKQVVDTVKQFLDAEEKYSKK